MNKNFLPGDKIWVVWRDTNGNARNIIGYYFISEVAGYVIVFSGIEGEFGINSLMKYNAQVTAENYETDLLVFPVVDCFSTKEAAFVALEKESEPDDEIMIQKFNY